MQPDSALIGCGFMFLITPVLLLITHQWVNQTAKTQYAVLTPLIYLGTFTVIWGGFAFFTYSMLYYSGGGGFLGGTQDYSLYAAMALMAIVYFYFISILVILFIVYLLLRSTFHIPVLIGFYSTALLTWLFDYNWFALALYTIGWTPILAALIWQGSTLYTHYFKHSQHTQPVAPGIPHTNTHTNETVSAPSHPPTVMDNTSCNTI